MEIYFQEQKNKILRQLKFAKENIPAYRNRFADIDLNSIKDYSDFSTKIPIINSEEVVNNPELFCSNLPIKFTRHSSSTTGKPKKVFLTSEDLKLWVEKGRLTLTPYFKEGDIVAFSKREEKHYLSGLKEAIELSKGRVLNFNPRDINELLDCVKKADIILDYAEMIYYISDQISKINGVNLNKTIKLSYTGNFLSEEDILKIRKNFNNIGIDARVYSEYATTEIGPIGCSDYQNQRDFKLIYNDISFLEIVDPKSNEPAQRGEVVATTLNRTGSVFIRYKIGDLGELSCNEDRPIFHLEKRKKGLKVASVFFSPEQAFNFIREFLKQPVFCEMSLDKEEYFNTININIIGERAINDKETNELKKALLNELELTDDEAITSKVNLVFIKDRLNDQQIRKGFKII